MTEEAFLRGALAAPGDEALRLVYADWLEERGDARAELLRRDWDVQFLLRYQGEEGESRLEHYLEEYPELRTRLKAIRQDEAVRIAGLRRKANQEWLAFFDSLAHPPRPFFLWRSEAARPPEAEMPFTEPLATRGGVVTFPSSFRDDSHWGPGLLSELRLLLELWAPECYYGPASYPAFPFVCELEGAGGRLTGADVLRALKARHFTSDYNWALDAEAIPFPGDHSGQNDRCHTDPAHSLLFPEPGDEDEGPHQLEDDARERRARWEESHSALRAVVADNRLWYVLLHGPLALDSPLRVALFAVGRSRDGRRLMGVVTSQNCFNFCD